MRTLRSKLAFLYLAVFGVIQTVLCVIILAIREADLRRDLDERLADRAESVLDRLQLSGFDARTPSATDADSVDLRLRRWPGYFLQVRAADGTILARSPNLGRATLPAAETVRASPPSGTLILETKAGDEVEPLVGPAGKLRMLTLYTDDFGAMTARVQVARSLATVDASIRNLRRLFMFVVPGGLIAAGLASWFLARRSLAPIGRIAREARDLTAARLDRRIETPPGRDEAAELVATINEMLDRLESSFRGQEGFIANASHELKTPISVLLGEAQVLTQQAQTAEEYDRFVASVQEEMRRLGRLIDSLLLLARAEAGLPVSAMKPVPVNELVADAVQRCQPLGQQREVQLVPRLLMPQTGELEVLVTGDAQLLQAMAENLLRNAIQHSQPGAEVEVEVSAADGDILIAVRDRGPGLPPDRLETVFDRFFHDAPKSGTARGAGLGLTIAKSVVEMHQGSISAANREGGGCVFTARLPAEPAS
ncbi:MAG: HAMP domain-containing sensor histidine kinase [Planctomycetota bacterium]